MYTDKKKKIWPWILLGVVVIALVLGVYFRMSHVSKRDIAEGSAEALKSAVQRSALQCYVVEGVYPPDLSYLEEHYGLQVNHEDFYIRYDAFASNLPPDIRVTAREK